MEATQAALRPLVRPLAAAALAAAATVAFPHVVARANVRLARAHPENAAFLMEEAASEADRLAIARRVAASPRADPFALALAAGVELDAGNGDAARSFAERAAEAFLPTGRWPELFADEVRTAIADNASLLGRLLLAGDDTRDEGVAWLMYAADVDPSRASEAIAQIGEGTLADCGDTARRAFLRWNGGEALGTRPCAPLGDFPRDGIAASMRAAGFRALEPSEADGASDGIIPGDDATAIYTSRAPYRWSYGPAALARGRARWLMLASGRANGVGALVRVESSLGWSTLVYLPDPDWFAVELPPRGTEASETVSLHLLSAGTSTAWRLPDESGAPWYEHNRHAVSAGVWICAEEAP